MRRKLFSVAAAVSGVLCAALLIAWAVSYWRWDVVAVNVVRAHGRDWVAYRPEVLYGWGALILTMSRHEGRNADAPPTLPLINRYGGSKVAPWHTVNFGAAPYYRNFLGFAAFDIRDGWRSYSRDPFGIQFDPKRLLSPSAAAALPQVRSSTHRLLIPLWFAVLVTAVAPLLAGRSAWRARRLARAKAGLCAACGYDLRATPERCPECGAEPAAR